jgi:hypothetical protein
MEVMMKRILANKNRIFTMVEDKAIIEDVMNGCYSLGNRCRIRPKKFLEDFFIEIGEGGDDYKITRQWVFETGGKYLTVYDWKMTSTYSTDLPSVSDFWNSHELEYLYIGIVADEDEELAQEFEDLLTSFYQAW